MSFCGRTSLLFLALFRIINVFLVQTYFVPDEYWQSLEVAHNLSYAYGYLTWEWKEEIRSCSYPVFIALLYTILPPSSFVLTIVPRIFQAVLSAFGDYFTLKMASKVFGSSVAKWTLFSLLSSWFLFYCATRTLTNMAESSFIAIAGYYYPWSTHEKQRNPWTYMVPAGLSVMMRPTAAVIWLPLFLWHFLHSRLRAKLLMQTALIGVVFVCLLMLVDYQCYGHWVFTPLRFFMFNWTHDIGAFYGSNPWHFYFTIGFSTVMGTHLIPFLVGSFKESRPMQYLIIYFMIVFSFLSHKEFRFLLPILPFCMCICGAGLSKMCSGQMQLWNWKIFSQAGFLYCVLMLVINVILALYTGLLHQRGVMDAVSYLSSRVKDNSNVLFLMPCHSTPYYSHIHKNITMKFLTCEPNFSSDANYIDEAEQFYKNPRLWLRSFLNSPNTRWPSHIVLFDNLFVPISSIILGKYYVCFAARHTNFPQGRIGEIVYIFCRH